MIRRILLFVFVAWFAVAPVIADSCAAECEKTNRAAGLHLVDQHAQAEQQADVPDCHQVSNDGQQSGDTETSNAGAMAAACFVAAAVAMHTPTASLVTIDLSAEHDVRVLLPSASFQPSPPYKPPRA